MSENIIKIFTTPQEFPCGADAACCGPFGQTEEEVQILKQGLEGTLSLPVRVVYVKDGGDMRDHRQILALLRSFGWGVLPIIAVDDEVVSMGLGRVEKVAASVRRKLIAGSVRSDDGADAVETRSS